MSTAKIKILYILGHAWSGTTLLGNSLGELDGFFHIGEFHNLWRWNLLEGRECACGATLGQCEVWAPVLRATFGATSAQDIDPGKINRWQQQAFRPKNRLRLMRAAPGRPSSDPSLDLYAQLTARLYRNIQQVTGARVIVDSSKRSGVAALFKLLPDLDPFFVHLVRDPRATAYSWRRRQMRGQPMPRSGPAKSVRDWLFVNLGSEAVRRQYGPDRFRLVRYEDFVASPGSSLRGIAGMVGEEPGNLPLLDERTIQINRNHMLKWNPGRFASGRVELRHDLEWRTGQPPRDRLLATAWASPLMRRYRYRMRGTTQPA